MHRAHLDDLPDHQLPDGYRLRGMRPADAATWTAVQRDAEPWLEVGDGLFADNAATIAERCFLLEDADGRAGGTISAWFDPDFRGHDHGRIHWVALRPDWQGRGLAKPMLAHAMRVLARFHDCAYLCTQANRLPAIALYLGFGFGPLIADAGDRATWQAIARRFPPHLARLCR